MVAHDPDGAAALDVLVQQGFTGPLVDGLDVDQDPDLIVAGDADVSGFEAQAASGVAFDGAGEEDVGVRFPGQTESAVLFKAFADGSGNVCRKSGFIGIVAEGEDADGGSAGGLGGTTDVIAETTAGA